MIFDAIDSDKDENVSKIEFANYFKSLNIKDEAIADHVFKAMDANQDDTLNKEGDLNFY